VSLPLRPPPLAGREELISLVHAHLTAASPPGMVVLAGIGGVGKTSTAAEYAHRSLAEVSVACQIPAENPTVLGQGITRLAGQLDSTAAVDPLDPAATVHTLLAAWPSAWLLVFDNAPDEASVRRFLPPAGPGRVIITSQSQHWPGRTVLDVPLLDNEGSWSLAPVTRTRRQQPSWPVSWAGCRWPWNRPPPTPRPPAGPWPPTSRCSGSAALTCSTAASQAGTPPWPRRSASPCPRSKPIHRPRPG
jgi:hypothetical protein